MLKLTSYFVVLILTTLLYVELPAAL